MQPTATIPVVNVPITPPVMINVPFPQRNPTTPPVMVNVPFPQRKPTTPPVMINVPFPQRNPTTPPVMINVPFPQRNPTTPVVSHNIPQIPTINIPVPQRTPNTLRFDAAPVEVKELALRPWQTEWAQRAHRILLRNHGYIDTSRMGSGKTYVTLWLAKQFGFRLIIVCPLIMVDVWKRTASEYGIHVLNIISYQSLRSQANHQPKHGYLDRYDNITEGGVHQLSFVPTQAYLDLVETGVMVVFDEIQNIKNSSAQYKACSALLRPIIAGGGRSRFGLLSGTPFDKEEHAVNLLKLIGYIRSHRLYNYVRETRETVLEGMQELIDACHFINPTETDRVLSETPPSKAKMIHLCYVLYTRVVKAYISGAMPAPTTILGQFDVKNGFFNMAPQRAEQLRRAVDELAEAVAFNERTGTAEIRADNIGAVTTALVHIENAKVDDFARVATGILMDNPNNKVIISVNYTNTINEISNLLIMFNPLILNGKVPAPKRRRIVDFFNDDPYKRVLIMNTAVGGVGISLHDTTGNYPRFMLMSPSYKLLEITQAAGRIYRDGTMSDATVRMFYGKGTAGVETSILTAMARKTQVLRGTLEDNVTQNLILPGEYASIEETARGI